jgi:streptogramin lyase
VPVGSDPRLGGELAGYRLVSLLGRGGMGAVYLAEDTALGRKVALKLLAAQLTESRRFRERFLRESQLAASLDHPHVVPIYAAGEADGQLYLAMRYVDGYDLKQLLAREGKLAPGRALTLLAQVADALDAAHERGLVHRDVKPGNVLIAAGSGREHCYLADFGLTKQTASISGLTGTGELVGTVEYVSPEQIRGDAVDRRSDVYALACVLHECLTGEPPYERDSEVATLWAHVNDPPPGTRLGLALDTALARGLAKAPEARSRSCGELVGEAAAALGLRTTFLTARRRSAPIRLTRRRLLAAGAAAAAGSSAAAALLTRRDGELARIGPTSIGVIDAATRKLVGEVPIGFKSDLIAAGEGFVWIVDGPRGTLRKIDPATMRMVATDAIATAAATGIVVDAGSIWIALAGDRVLRFGTDVGKPRLIRLGDRDYPMVLASGLGAIWAFMPELGRLSRIDPATNHVTWSQEGLLGLAVAAGRAGVWLADRATLVQVDPASGEQVDSIYPIGDPRVRARNISLAVGKDAVWFAAPFATKLWRIDGQQPRTIESFPAGRGPAGIALDEGAVWVANSSGNSVSRIDPVTGALETIRLGAPPGRLVAAFGKVWTSPGEPQS